MAKKKTNKKPVSKRITKAAPKTRKPRTPRAQKPEVVVTTEPAIETVWRSGTVEEFLADTAPAPAPVAETYKFTVQPVEFTRMKSPTLAETLKSQWDELTNSFANAPPAIFWNVVLCCAHGCCNRRGCCHAIFQMVSK
jgi:hypothetical protein